MDPQNWVLFIVTILDILIGLIILSGNYKKETNISYFFLVLFTAAWTLGIAFFRVSETREALFFWNKFFIITAGFIASFFLHFSLIYHESKSNLSNLFRVLIHYPNFFFILAVIFFPDFFIKDILKQDWGNESLLGWGYPYYGLYFMVFYLWGFFILFKKYKLENSPKGRKHLLFILIGPSISIFFGSLFNLIFILLGNYKYIWLGPYASFIMLLFVAYGIIRYRLLDIKLVLRKSFVYSASVLTVVWLGVGLEMVLELFFSGFTTGILVLIIGVSVFTKVRDFFY
ncbi:MAG: hypothetical protein GF335_02245, partial [Candidatus Moranbacteria bacterium]|nr:hypothetical protein [Candidatus Moranbacteria bacterium]